MDFFQLQMTGETAEAAEEGETVYIPAEEDEALVRLGHRPKPRFGPIWVQGESREAGAARAKKKLCVSDPVKKGTGNIQMIFG